MQLNVSTCYAMQIMLYLVRNNRVVSSSELSGSLNISQRYVLQIAGKLRDGGMAVTYPGASGGYALNVEASSVSVYDVITLKEGDMSIPDCVARVSGCNGPCMNSNLFDTLSVMKDYLNTYLKTVTFDKLAEIETSGKLSEIISLVDAHTEAIKQRVN